MKRAITLYYDDDSGELARVKIHKNFQKADLLMKVDVLQDSIGALENMYNNSSNTYFNSLPTFTDVFGDIKNKEKV